MSNTKQNTKQQAPNNKNNQKPFCKVCHAAGKTEAEFTSHYVRSSANVDGVVICPTLLNQNCRYCHQNGHTVKFCSLLKQKDSESEFEKVENKKRKFTQASPAPRTSSKPPTPSAPKKSKNKNLFQFLESDSDDDDDTNAIPAAVRGANLTSLFNSAALAEKKEPITPAGQTPAFPASYAAIASKTKEEYEREREIKPNSKVTPILDDQNEEDLELQKITLLPRVSRGRLLDWTEDCSSDEDDD